MKPNNNLLKGVRIMNNFRKLSLMLVLFFLAACATSTWPPEEIKARLLQKESVRQQLYSEIRNISFVINISPSLVSNINKSPELKKVVNELRKIINSYDLPIVDEIITYKPEKLSDLRITGTSNCTSKICGLDISNPTLFEKFIPTSPSSNSSFVFLVDGEFTQPKSDKNYISFAMAILVNGKRTDAGGEFSFEKSYSKNPASKILMPIAAAQMAYDVATLSDSEYMIKRMVSSRASVATITYFHAVAENR